MAKGRREGLSGLVGSLTDEAKRFADERMPYPVERNLRRAAGSVVDDQPVAATVESSMRGIGYAVFDDGSDQAERDQAERAQAAELAALAQLRARVEVLNAAVERLRPGLSPASRPTDLFARD